MIKTPNQIEHAHSICETEFDYTLNCWVKFNHLKYEVPFTAAANDPEPYGRDLYRRLVAGEFGQIHPKGSFPDGASQWVKSPREIVLTPKSSRFLCQGLGEANLENSRGTPRGIVLVWSALLEIALSQAIRSRLPHALVNKTLGGKIRQLSDADLISDDDDFKDLKAIRDIRNHATHNLRFSHFDHLLEEQAAFDGYSRLYAGYAEAMFNEVADLLFVARFVFASSCLSSIERVCCIIE